MGNKMIKARLLSRFVNGDIAVIHQLDAGQYACMFCGEPLLVPQYEPVDPSDPEDISGFEFGAVCPRCDTELGVDDGIVSHHPPGHRKLATAYRRWKYLEHVGWSREALDLIRENLGLSEDEVRQEITEMRAAWNL